MQGSLGAVGALWYLWKDPHEGLQMSKRKVKVI